ncbi:mammalian cell entry protein [Mycobacteroides saopaulense]|uniref:Mammalian cell entry protein n=1 Tax=Mycobacteroides saopaulense TaxID=1578165 RepID=A0A1X0J9A9_9MYCO|nr:MlaD family protein [Mycobacteroides saopaulense]ORB59448.1 mammalian cell entry protein [Mycobacteroides saopaulense]
MMRRRLSAFAAIMVLCTGCSTGGLADLPLPAPGLGGGGYRLTAVFANALNLPERAKVKLAGADIGEVESMAAKDFHAVTTLRIRHDVTLSAGSTAQLRTATPLGDVFVAITAPERPHGGTLADGDTIPIDQTAAAATVESVLSSAAILVNGGAVRNLTNVVNGMGRAAGPDGEAFGRMIGKSNELLGKLNARSGQLDAAMTQTARLAEALDGRSEELGQVLHAAGPATATLQENAGQISDLVLLLGDTARELGKFPSIAGTDTSGRSVVADANAISRSWNDVVLDPETRLLSLNRLYAPFIKITAGSYISGRAGIDRLVLGAIPDAGFGGDPGFHGPKRYDWNKLVGTLKYSLWRLQERVVGQGPEAQGPEVQSPASPEAGLPGSGR